MPVLAVALCLALVALGFGCGDDDDSSGETTSTATTSSSSTASTTTSAETSTAEFTAAADAICAEESQEIEGFEEAVGRARTFGDFEAAITKALPALEDQVERLSAVPRPAGDPVPGAYISTLDRGLELMRDLKQAAVEGDEAGLQSTAEALTQLNAEQDQLLAGYGFEECGN